jgi:hypothetical protein
MSARSQDLPMQAEIVRWSGGTVTIPVLVLNDRADGGHLVVNPPREVWERSELTAPELAAWAILVSATGAAMLECLPQLRDGCVNYWEAGNWSLHADAEPAGWKAVRSHRWVHLHLFGRSPAATHADWLWGEAPAFPRFADRLEWAREFKPLTSSECASIGNVINRRLRAQS